MKNLVTDRDRGYNACLRAITGLKVLQNVSKREFVKMSMIRSVTRLAAVIALSLIYGQVAMGADDEGATSPAASRIGGRSQQRAILHTADSLETVLNRVNEKAATLIDVREQTEWEAGHLTHAVFLPLSELKKAAGNPEVQEKLAKLSKDKIVYCHCKAGGRVLTAAPILKSLGFDVRPLKAGYDALLDAGFERATPNTQVSD